MTRSAEVRDAIIELAGDKAEPGQPVNLFDIGPTHVSEKNYSQDEVVNAISAVQSDAVIRLLDGNRIVVLK